jgi:dinuclear metal center YbgI/SA1388 family protein
MHMEVGNNAGLADALELHNREPFGMYHGIKIGVKGELSEPLDMDSVLKKIGLSRDTALGVLEFGRREIKSVGIISGGADKEVSQAIEEGLDLYITGELSHQVYHSCLESGINLVAGGHYHTETYGVRKLMQVLRDEYDVETVFIDVPTGL